MSFTILLLMQLILASTVLEREPVYLIHWAGFTVATFSFLWGEWVPSWLSKLKNHLMIVVSICFFVCVFHYIYFHFVMAQRNFFNLSTTFLLICLHMSLYLIDITVIEDSVMYIDPDTCTITGIFVLLNMY